MQSFHDSTRSTSNSSLVLASGMFSSGSCCLAGLLISLILLLFLDTFYSCDLNYFNLLYHSMSSYTL